MTRRSSFEYPATRQQTKEDVARILDPSYYSPSSSPGASSSMPYMRSAYVDTHGDLHDPDYRDFPAVYHHHNDFNTAVESDDEDSSVSVWAPAQFAQERERERRRRAVETQQLQVQRRSFEHTRDEYVYATLPPSPPAESCSSQKSRHVMKRYRSRRSSCATSSSVASSLSSTPSSPYSLDASLEEEEAIVAAQSTESLPTFNSSSPVPISPSTAATTPAHAADTRDALRRQWQAVSMRVKFGVFRAGRRWGVV